MLKKIVVLLFVTVFSANGFCADLIINEFCAVGSEKWLETDTYAGSNAEDTYFAWLANPSNGSSKITGTMPNGRIQGNGGDWIELVVIKDHLDIRNWQIRWAEVGGLEANGSDIWYGNGNVEQGILQFSNDTLWSNLRSGTIITVIESSVIYVDTTNGMNQTYNVGPSQAEATLNVDTDTSFDPNNGDWWINVSVRGESGRPNPLITSVHNVLSHPSWDFGVGNDDWQAQINKTDGTLEWGPVGEALAPAGWGGTGISSKEVGRLEKDPSANRTGADFDDADSSSFGMPNVWGDPIKSQDFRALRAWLNPPTDCAGVVDLGLNGKFDFNKDCYVDFADFAYFAQNWLSCTNPGDPNCATPWIN
jgi:hypothetical protein